jgi:hypothetical protein
MRISYFGKEIVISKYNYYKKLKKNHLSAIHLAQERVRANNIGGEEEKDDTFRVANTILH